VSRSSGGGDDEGGGGGGGGGGDGPCAYMLLPLSRYVRRQENKPTTNAMDERPCYPYVSMMIFGWASINAQACFTEHQRFYIKQLVYTPLRTYKQVTQCFGFFFSNNKKDGIGFCMWWAAAS
jgi:hypothetical protein